MDNKSMLHAAHRLEDGRFSRFAKHACVRIAVGVVSRFSVDSEMQPCVGLVPFLLTKDCSYTRR